jgi:4-hydroxybenzoate polyprenyltransferase
MIATENDQYLYEKDKSLIERFWIYQSERFPFFQHGLMILTFTFSAVSYSRICRGETGFISPINFIIGAITSFCFFFLLRVFDEFKDAEDDANFRPYRPVPRGLISLKEIGWIGFGVIILQISLNFAIMPVMLWAYVIGLAYMGLMTKEFFVSSWLKSHPIVYMVSHMAIMPMIDFYTTGLDWINAGMKAPHGLVFFLIVTFLNGIVIEIGRKIRSKEAEEYGVETYSTLWGSKRATVIWLVTLFITFIFANAASYFAGFGSTALIFLIIFIALCSFPALRFIKTQNQSDAKKIELAAGIWTIGMYLTLGAVPMIINLIRG